MPAKKQRKYTTAQKCAMCARGHNRSQTCPACGKGKAKAKGRKR